jgi:penicillin-binding protein 2
MKSGWRLGAIAVLFVGLFGILTLQLWQVQVVATEDYVQRAADLQVKSVHTPAPRGQIVDRNQNQLAGTRPALAAVVDGALVPAADVDQLVSLLAAFSGLPSDDVAAIVADARDRGDRRVVVSDLDEDDAVFLTEHADEFPGVSMQPIPQRTYPYGNLASGVLGYIGRPTQTDIDDGGYKSTDILGKAGIEKQYDAQLQGTEGTIRFQVDAFRNVLGVLGEEYPEPGNTIVLELDVELQQLLEQTLQNGLDLARSRYNEDGCEPSDEDKGCPVRAVGLVENIKNGAILAMGSVPNFDPTIFVDGSYADTDLPEGALQNFAVQGQYAPASTFKAVTYAMAMEEGVAPEGVSSVEDQILCSGRLARALGEGSQNVFFNWTHADDGMQNIHTALMRSCNTYFWEVAYSLWDQYKGTPKENLLQDWARNVGFDSKTGIDLPFEKSGIIPDRQLFTKWAEEEPNRLDPNRLQYESPWFGGDLFQAAVGQGSVLATPVQMATAYGALVNGGVVWKPRVVKEIRTKDGDLLVEEPATTIRVVDELQGSTVRALRHDLQQVVNNPRGTAYSAFSDFGANVDQVGGKTGTAEIIKRQTDDNGSIIQDSVTTALFFGVAPIDNPQYIVVIIIERGGSGGGIAAPTAKPILQYLLNGPDAVTPIAPGTEAD